jgi:hypothetical protein
MGGRLLTASPLPAGGRLQQESGCWRLEVPLPELPPVQRRLPRQRHRRPAQLRPALLHDDHLLLSSSDIQP